jgi:hypothetical protein
MTEFHLQPQPTPAEINEALRSRILVRAKEINGTLLARFATVSDDLDARRARAALGGLDGIERDIQTMRSLLLLFS